MAPKTENASCSEDQLENKGNMKQDLDCNISDVEGGRGEEFDDGIRRRSAYSRSPSRERARRSSFVADDEPSENLSGRIDRRTGVYGSQNSLVKAGVTDAREGPVVGRRSRSASFSGDRFEKEVKFDNFNDSFRGGNVDTRNPYDQSGYGKSYDSKYGDEFQRGSDYRRGDQMMYNPYRSMQTPAYERYGQSYPRSSSLPRFSGDKYDMYRRSDYGPSYDASRSSRYSQDPQDRHAYRDSSSGRQGNYRSGRDEYGIDDCGEGYGPYSRPMSRSQDFAYGYNRNCDSFNPNSYSQQRFMSRREDGDFHMQRSSRPYGGERDFERNPQRSSMVDYYRNEAPYYGNFRGRSPFGGSPNQYQGPQEMRYGFSDYGRGYGSAECSPYGRNFDNGLYGNRGNYYDDQMGRPCYNNFSQERDYEFQRRGRYNDHSMYDSYGRDSQYRSPRYSSNYDSSSGRQGPYGNYSSCGTGMSGSPYGGFMNEYSGRGF